MDDILRDYVNRAIADTFPDNRDALKNASVTFHEQENNKSFWSRIVRAKILWSHEEDSTQSKNDEKPSLPNVLFIKLPHLSDNVLNDELDDAGVSELFDTLRELTQNEVSFYRLFGSSPIEGFRFPRMYLAEELVETGSGGLVLEDITNAVSSDFIPGFNLGQVFSIVRALAAFHHYVITTKDRRWETTFFENRIDEDFQALQYKRFCTFETICPELFAGNMTELQSLFSIENAMKSTKLHRESGLPSVLVHTDLNPTNILWSAHSTNSQIGSFIDFQMIHEGSITEDIIRVLTLGLSTEERRRRTDDVLTEYHRELCRLFNGNSPVTIEQVRKDYKEQFSFGCNFTLFAFSTYHKYYNESDMQGEHTEHCKNEIVQRVFGLVEDLKSLAS